MKRLSLVPPILAPPPPRTSAGREFTFIDLRTNIVCGENRHKGVDK
jgi:hypothetical protein